MKVTVSTIATNCNLSTATVDRVLNDRPGVSAANRHRVMEAAQRLGYLPVLDSVTLPSRPARLEFFIPIGANGFMRELAQQIEIYCKLLPLVASCRVHDLGALPPADLHPVFEQLRTDAKGVGIVALDRPATRNTLRDLVEGGVRVVTMLSDVPATLRSAYIGLDNRVAGRTAALLIGRLLGKREGQVFVLTGSHSYRGHEEREMGFRSVMNEEFAHLSIAATAEINDEPEAGYLAARSVLQSNPAVVGVYCVGAGRSGVVRALKELKRSEKPIFICHDLTRETRGFLIDGHADVVIDQNARLIAEQSVIRLLGSIASTAPYLTIKHIEPRLIFKENLPVQ